MIVAAHILHQHLKLHQIMQDYVIILVGDELLGILISSSLPCLFVLHMQLVQPLSHIISSFEIKYVETLDQYDMLSYLYVVLVLEASL